MEIAVALVGFGLGGSVFHAPLIRVTRGLRLKSVVTSRAEQVSRIPGISAVPGLDDALADPEVKLVVVTTPSGLHFEHARAALLAGKHVVVDKPVALRAAEADELIRLARDRGLVLSVFQNRRWDGDYIAVKNAIRTGLIGDVYHFEAHYDRFRMEIRSMWKEQSGPGSGILYDLGSHVIDQAFDLFGMPDSVTADAFAQRPGAQAVDYFHLTLHYGAMRAILHSSMMTPKPGPHFAVHGDRGSVLTYGMDFQEEALRKGKLPGDPRWGLDEACPRGEVFGADGSHCELDIPPGRYQAFYAGMAEAIAGGAEPPVEPEQSRDGLLVLEAALRSVEEKRTVDLR